MTTRFLIALLALVALTSAASAADVRCARLVSGVVDGYVVFGDAIRADRPSAFDADGCPVDAPHKNIDWRPAPKAVTPAYDAATQILIGPTVTVEPTQVTESYTVRDKTAQELAQETDERRENILSGIGEVVLRRLCDHESRIRVLEGKTAVTWEQCRQAIKSALP